MSQLSFARFYDLREMYERTVEFEQRRLQELTMPRFGLARDTGEQRLVLDKLHVLEQTAGRRGVELSVELEREVSSCLEKVMQGATCGDVACDIAIPVYGMLAQLDSIVSVLQSVTGYLNNYTHQEVVVVRHYIRPMDEDSMFIPTLIDIDRIRYHGKMNAFANSEYVHQDKGMVENYERTLAPAPLVLRVYGLGTTERLVKMVEGELQRGTTRRVESLDLDVRVLPFFRYAADSLIAQVAELGIPMKLDHTQYRTREILRNNSDDLRQLPVLSSVEIISGHRVPEVLRHYLG